MAGEPADGREEGLDLPPELGEWLDRRATDLGVDRPELVVQVLGAYRAVADQDADALPTMAARDLDDRLSEFRTALDGDLDDIRRRVVQVKRETDRKAPADHTHDALEDRLAAVEEEVSSLAGRVERLGDEAVTAEQLAGREERLADAEEKLTRVASAVVALQRERETAAADRLADIKRRASRLDVEAAACHACEERVSIALLPDGHCPHCGTAFGELSAASNSIFDRPRLTERQDNE